MLICLSVERRVWRVKFPDSGSKGRRNKTKRRSNTLMRAEALDFCYTLYAVVKTIALSIAELVRRAQDRCELRKCTFLIMYFVYCPVPSF